MLFLLIVILLIILLIVVLLIVLLVIVLLVVLLIILIVVHFFHFLSVLLLPVFQKIYKTERKNFRTKKYFNAAFRCEIENFFIYL